MLTVLEGCDRSGKSTLAAALRREYGFEVEHRGAPTQHPLIEYGVPLEQHRPFDKLVMDRWHWGEYVWPQVFGRKSELTMEMLYWLELLLRSRGGEVTYCTDTVELLIERNREWNELKPWQVHAAETLYASLFERFCGWVCSDALDVSATIQVNGRARRREEQAAVIHSITSGEYVGAPDAALLLVGEELAPARADRPHAVPFAPYRGTSGEYLMGTLINCVFWGTNNVAITNAHLKRDARRPVDAQSLVSEMGPECVVALGNTAHRVLTAQNIEHGVVPHPQSVRRFHYARLPLYVAAITEAAFEGRDTREWFR